MSTLDRAAEQLARALAMLDDYVASETSPLLSLLGWEPPPGVADIGLAAIDLSALAGSLRTLEQVKVSGTDIQVTAAFADVVEGVADGLAQLRRVASTFTAPADYLTKTDIVNQFFPRLLDF